MTQNFTQHMHIPIPDFATKPWNDDMELSLERIDAAIFNSIISDSVAPWTNATLYELGFIAIDNTSGLYWVCCEDHTSSPAPQTFIQERAQHPTRWKPATAVPANLGEWQTGVAYNVTDHVSHGFGYYVCNTQHTSGTFNVDLAAGYWTTLVDFTAQIAMIEVRISTAEAYAMMTQQMAKRAKASVALAAAQASAAASSAAAAAASAAAYDELQAVYRTHVYS